MEENSSRCPVCGLEQERRIWDICPRCHWEYDTLQENHPDYDGGANVMSLNQAREAWQSGKEVE